MSALELEIAKAKSTALGIAGKRLRDSIVKYSNLFCVVTSHRMNEIDSWRQSWKTSKRWLFKENWSASFTRI